jgi:transcriptional regulator with XRE-family HTH domain
MIGTVIRELRSQSGMTREQLATKAGISHVMLSKIEQGARNPGPKTTLRLAKVLKTTPEVLTDSVVISKAEYKRLLANQK